MNDELLQAVKDLLADIEEMRDGYEWFGGFGRWRGSFGDAFIEWLNLAISADKVRSLLDKGGFVGGFVSMDRVEQEFARLEAEAERMCVCADDYTKRGRTAPDCQVHDFIDMLDDARSRIRGMQEAGDEA